MRKKLFRPKYKILKSRGQNVNFVKPFFTTLLFIIYSKSRLFDYQNYFQAIKSKTIYISFYSCKIRILKLINSLKLQKLEFIHQSMHEHHTKRPRMAKKSKEKFCQFSQILGP